MCCRLFPAATLAASIATLGCTHPKEYPGLGYGPECQSARTRALAYPTAPEIRLTSPTFLLLPPVPIPASEVGDTAVVDLDVDVYGRPEKGTVRITGVRDLSYVRRFIAAVEEWNSLRRIWADAQ